MVKVQKTLTMDLISQLPEHILHNILFRLPPEDAVRTCVLSKTWTLIEARNPFMHFFDHYLEHVQTMLSCAEKRVERFSHNKNSSASISSFLFHAIEWCNDYDLRFFLMLERVIMNAIQKFDVDVPCYSLPASLFHSQTLTVLNLNRCMLNSRVDIWLPKLEKLYFFEIELEEGFVERMLLGCPLLWQLSICGCNKIKSLGVTNHGSLKWVNITCCYDLRKVEIDQSSNILCYFKYTGKYPMQHCDINLKFDPPKKVVLMSIMIASCWLQRQLSRCEELTLDKVDCVDGIEISSKMLSKLMIFGCNNEKKNLMRIDCPNLQSLAYVNNHLPFCSKSEFKSLQDIEIECCIQDHHAIWYDNMKDFFKKLSFDNKKLIKQIVRYDGQKDLIILDGLRDFMIPELCNMEGLTPKQPVVLTLLSSSRGLNILVDNICKHLVQFFNTSINVVSAHHLSNNTISKIQWQVLCDKLSSNRVDKANCCRQCYEQDKCWRHYLCNATIDSTINNIPLALRSHPFHQYQITRIVLEWTNEATRDFTSTPSWTLTREWSVPSSWIDGYKS